MRLIIIALFVTNSLNGQITRPLVVGDFIPNIELKNLLNNETSTAKLFDLKKELLIIDFWATWCSPCIATIPKLDSLQNHYRSRLKILSVTSEKKSVVELFFEKRKKSLPMTVVEDKVLRQLFPHTTLPHYVWIDGAGKIIAITGTDELDQKNIELVLNKKVPDFKIKRDIEILIDSDRPMLVTNAQVEVKKEDILFQNNSNVHRSILTRYNPQVSGGGQTYKDNRITVRNMSLSDLYKTAFGDRKLEFVYDGRVLLNVSDTAKFRYMDKLNEELWIRENGYCYELVLNDSADDPRSKRALSIMQQELNFYFGFQGIRGSLKKQKVKSLALIQYDKGPESVTKGDHPAVVKNAFYYKLTNGTTRQLINDLSYYWQNRKLPVIDLTGYAEKIDIEINAKLSDLNAVNKELAKYGLKVISTEKEVDMIVISDNPFYTNYTTENSLSKGEGH